MENLDVDALLEKNPQVDGERINKRVREGAFSKTTTRKPFGSPSPYGGRRMIVDDRPIVESGVVYKRDG